MRITRRKLAATVLGSAVALAQAPPPPLPRTPQEELAAARDQAQRAVEVLARFNVPMATEPACHFRA
ncbi:MAG TPA: hypothetical protein VG672_20630 [Bryobacteraceae bacterium]|nr:hypothetical protein [Bryobacteraceae bacterium]